MKCDYGIIVTYFENYIWVRQAQVPIARAQVLGSLAGQELVPAKTNIGVIKKNLYQHQDKLLIYLLDDDTNDILEQSPGDSSHWP